MASRGALIGILGGRGVCRPVLQVLTLFQTQKCHFPHRFKTWPVRNYVDHNWLEETLKRFLKTHMILHTFIYSRCSLEKHTWIQTKIGQKFIPVLRPKRRKNPSHLGRHILSPGVAWSMYVYRQPRALQNTGKIEIFSYVSLICIYKME